MARFNEVHTDHFVCDRRKTISLEENKKKYLANNVSNKLVAQYHLDTTTAPPKKCDYAIYIFDNENPLNDDNRVIFVELKGSDISEAIEQICQSINDRIIQPKIDCKYVDARIVASQCPPPRYYGTKEVKLNQLLIPHGRRLKIGSNKYYEENI